MSSSPSPNDPLATVPSDRLWLRSELMGTQVITRDSGRRLGVVGEVVVDIDRREVVALGLRDNPLTRFLPGLPRWMPLDRIRQVGDVILVDSADSLSEGFSPDRYSRVINCQVITESGQTLGRVLGFSFDIETGELTTLVMGAVGVPLLGEGVLSTWEIPVDEIVSSGADRIIVYEGAEDKLKQLSSGVLEKLGVGGPSWEEQERERYRVNIVPVENQLSSGQAVEEAPRMLEASDSQRFETERELEYVELEDRRSENTRERRYLDEAPMQERDSSYREPYRQSESYNETPSYREPEPFKEPEAYSEDRRFREPEPERFREPEPFQDQDRYQEPQRAAAPQQLDAAPRLEQRPRPASRRPIERPGEPLDVEPIEARSPQEPESQPLDDPW
ncbi:PRC-barrel domain-containing protein [Synechococcus sp. WH 8016]|uniref:PRC-barrel domain-containing protein n=1 Tax=Synechococcus sp. WH 8016 TaxID=166318 RepID=UPI000571A21A|nr:PRC-barrel domain-containing protein [Synechococcus sp. WH 8016]